MVFDLRKITKDINQDVDNNRKSCDLDKCCSNDEHAK